MEVVPVARLSQKVFFDAHDVIVAPPTSAMLLVNGSVAVAYARIACEREAGGVMRAFLAVPRHAEAARIRH